MIAKTYSKTASKCSVTFRIPADIVAESISVLGDFNDWDPQAHQLKARKNGTFSTTVSLDAGQAYRFRYLANGEIWLNDDEADGLGRLPIPLQSGTGSWDSFIGLVVSHETLQGGFHSQLTYHEKMAANNFEAGDVSQLDLSWQRRVWPKKLQSNSSAFVYAVLEANIIHSEKSRASGQVNDNSGGTTVFITPGIQYASKKLILEAALQIPIHQDLNGTALENNYIIRAGFRVNY